MPERPLEEFFTGNHQLLKQAFSPMTIRFFILQAHYRSTVDFSNNALEAAEKGFDRLKDAYARLLRIAPAENSSIDVKGLRERCEEAMSDDLNSPIVISHLFDSAKQINTIADGKVAYKR